MEREIERKGHVVLVPCPLQGHTNPMLHLANLLHSKGFSITIIHTQPKSPNSFSLFSPDFTFESIHDFSDDEDTLNGDFGPLFLALNLKCGPKFRDCLARMPSEGSRGDVSCIIHDAAMYFAVDVAEKLGIPRIALRTSTATNFLALSLLKNEGLLPVQEHQMEETVAKCPALRIKDMPVFNTCSQKPMEEVLSCVYNGTKTASAIIWNSLNCLEKTVLDKIQDTLLVPNFPIGPLQKHSKASLSSNSILAEDKGCIAWLDTQTPNSVIYVSTGSLITISESELIEMAWGLANSEQPFLWVVRPGLVHGSDGVGILPDGFKERTIGRGEVINWAPQQQVLAHRSVGGFWTHNGWNSTIESISEGVPMLCWPRVGDQRVNARLVSHVWRVGIQLEGGLERGNIENAIRKLMVEKEGWETRKRAVELKERVLCSLRKGGSSSDFLDKLVDFIRGQNLDTMKKSSFLFG